LSEIYGVPEENLLAGSGADELIDLLTRVVLEPSQVVINCVPTFGMYNFDTNLNYGKCINIQRKSDFSLDLGAIRNAVDTYKPVLIFLCSPNNPDGRLASEEEINTLLSLPTMVVLDEAYVEFTQKDMDLGYHQSLISR
jgi:histidinol-phosphate aminotransferase